MNRWLTPAIAFGFATSEATGNALWQSSRQLAMEPTDAPTDAPTFEPTATSSTTNVDDDAVGGAVQGINRFGIGVKYLEQCSGIHLDKGDCVVSSTLDTFEFMMSQQRRSLQEGCVFSEGMLLNVFNAARQACVEQEIEYSPEEFATSTNELLFFFGAEACWNDLCGGGIESSESYVTIFVDEVAECAGVQVESVNQCLWDQSVDILFLEGGFRDDDETFTDDVFAARRSLMEEPLTETSVLCSPSKAEVRPLIHTTVKEAERRCVQAGEELSEGDFVMAYNEFISLFTAPSPCWGEKETEGCGNGDDDDMGDDEVVHDDASDGINPIEIGVKYIEQCAAVELPKYDCLVSTVLDMMASLGEEGPPQHRFLQEGRSCDDAVVTEGFLLGLINEAENQCSHKHIHYSEERFDNRVDMLMSFFGAEDCWVSLCDGSDKRFMAILLDEVAVCAAADVANQCLWDETLNVFVSEMVSGGSDEDDSYSSENVARRVLQAVSGNSTSDDDDDDDMCHYEISEAVLATFISPLLVKAGQRCAMLGEEFGQTDIDTTFAEFTKLLFAPSKCWPSEADECWDERSVDVIKRSQEEIDSLYVDFVHENLLDGLMQCAGVDETSCVTTMSVELLMGTMRSCTTPVIDESRINRIVNKALMECTAKSNFIAENDHHEAIDYLMQIVSQPECWEGVCGLQDHDGLKRWWMATCSFNDAGLLFSDSEYIEFTMNSTIDDDDDTDDETILDPDTLKCMVDFILTEKRGDTDGSKECSLIQLGLNVCGADSSLGIEAYVHCSDNIILAEPPTSAPSPDSSSMSRNDSNWARMLEYELSLSLSYSMSLSYGNDDKMNDDFSMSYSYDDDDRMSYSYDDDDHYNHHDDDNMNDDRLPHHGQGYAYVSEVCHLLELIHYNPAMNDCMESMCDIKIDDVLTRNYIGMPPSSSPTSNPTVLPTSMPTPLESPTSKPTQAEGNFVPSPTSEEPTSLPTVKPTALPTLKPTSKPSFKPTLKPTLKRTSTPTARPTKARRGSVDVKFDVAVTLSGIKSSDLDLTALDAVVNLLEKVFASMLPENARARLLKVGGVSVARRVLRSLEDSEDGVDVEFEVVITKQCDDATCSNSEDLSATAYDDVTSDIKTKVEDGSLSTAIQEEADAEGVSELASVTVKPDSLVTGEAKVTVKEAEPGDDNDSASPTCSIALSVAVVSVSSLLFQCF